MIMVEDVIGDMVVELMGGTRQPHKANNGTCILWTSTTEEEDSFVRYTLRMLLHDLYFEYC